MGLGHGTWYRYGSIRPWRGQYTICACSVWWRTMFTSIKLRSPPKLLSFQNTVALHCRGRTDRRRYAEYCTVKLPALRTLLRRRLQRAGGELHTILCARQRASSLNANRTSDTAGWRKTIRADLAAASSKLLRQRNANDHRFACVINHQAIYRTHFPTKHFPSVWPTLISFQHTPIISQVKFFFLFGFSILLHIPLFDNGSGLTTDHSQELCFRYDQRGCSFNFTSWCNSSIQCLHRSQDVCKACNYHCWRSASSETQGSKTCSPTKDRYDRYEWQHFKWRESNSGGQAPVPFKAEETGWERSALPKWQEGHAKERWVQVHLCVCLCFWNVWGWTLCGHELWTAAVAWF